MPFPDETFDIVYSKGVIVHLPDSQWGAAFKEFYRVLKKGGTLVVHDWLSPSDACWSEKVQRLIEAESLPLYARSPQLYVEGLNRFFFQNVEYSNRSLTYASFNQGVVDRLSSEKIKNIFINHYGETAYQEHLSGYQEIRDLHHSGEIIGGHFIALK